MPWPASSPAACSPMWACLSPAPSAGRAEARQLVTLARAPFLPSPPANSGNVFSVESRKYIRQISAGHVRQDGFWSRGHCGRTLSIGDGGCEFLGAERDCDVGEPVGVASPAVKMSADLRG